MARQRVLCYDFNIMALGDLSLLEEEEAVLARVLLKNNLLTEEELNRFLAFRERRGTAGKKYIGGTLIDLGYISQANLDEYVKENFAQHTAFLHKITKEGYVTPEQEALIKKKSLETKGDVVTVISELNIMTRENYIRFFNNREPILRLGEWLVMKKKISQSQLDYAVKAQSVNSLEDYLTFHDIMNAETLENIKKKIAETYD